MDLIPNLIDEDIQYFIYELPLAPLHLLLGQKFLSLLVVFISSLRRQVILLSGYVVIAEAKLIYEVLVLRVQFI